MSQQPTGRCKHELSTVSLVAIVVANMVGVGVFVSSGYSLAALGNPGRVMLAWGLCGCWALSGAVAYGALVSRLPQSGGEYLFLSRLVHPSIGFLAGWISLIAGFTAPIALAAKSAAIHLLNNDVESGDIGVSLLAAVLIVVAAVFHLTGVRIGTSAQNAVVAIKLLLLAIIVVIAFAFTSAGDWQGAALPDRETTWLPADLSGWWTVVGSMSWLALSYTGFNAAVYVAGESRNATRVVPRAMLLGTLLVFILYLLLNYIFVYFPKPELIAGNELVAKVTAEALGGQRLADLVRVIVVLSTVSSVFAMLMLGPRVYHQMAVDGVFPRFFTDHTYRKTVALQCVLSVAICFSANILDLMSYLGLTLSACGAVAVSSLWWMKTRLPDSRPLRAYEMAATGFYLLFTALLIVATGWRSPLQLIAMGLTFALGLGYYALTFYKSPQKTA